MITTGLVYYNMYGISTQTGMTLDSIASKYYTAPQQYTRIITILPSDRLLSRCHTLNSQEKL